MFAVEILICLQQQDNECIILMLFLLQSEILEINVKRNKTC